jgi:REP element-mobilizing transposase RayT
MPRAPRKDYPGATHHIFVRAVPRTLVAVDAPDYQRTLRLIERTVTRFDLVCHAWCFLPNHGHLVLTCPEGNISRAMHWLGTCTAQSFNHRHDRSGHLYQGRFGSRVVKDDEHMRELARYLPLNPVRAGLCRLPSDWAWSSYAATAGYQPPPRFLDTSAFLGLLGSVARYKAWVGQGVDSAILDDAGVPVPPPRPSLASLLEEDNDRSIATAHFRYGYTQAGIARHLGVDRAQISRRLARRE